MVYIDQQNLNEIIQYLKNIKIEKPAHITFFLALKYIGISKHSITQTKSKEKSRDAIFLLMSLYDEDDEWPERGHLMYPFELGKQSITVDLKRFANNDIFNNIRNNPGRYNGIIRYLTKEDSEPEYSLEHNYVSKLSENLGISSDNRIDLGKFAGWIYRTHNFSNGAVLPSPLEFTRFVIHQFRKEFDINIEEESVIFYDSGFKLKPTNVKTSMKMVRQWINFNNTYKITKEKVIEMVPSIKVTNWNTIPSNNPDLREVYETLLTDKQIILYGIPGTGKTFLCKKIGDSFDVVKFIQFHQNFGYEEFIGGIRPDGNTFSIVDGILTDFALTAETENDKKFLLIIDEINRGNVSKIFGEAISCLDRDSPPVILSYNNKRKLKLPFNLFIIGTMNNVDRSIAFVDYALRRRFSFIFFFPDYEILKNVTNDHDKEMEGISIIELYIQLNNRLSEFLGNEFQLGHSYFMPHHLKNESNEFVWKLKDLERKMNYSIIPIIEEYCYGDKSLLESILGKELPQKLKGYDFRNALIRYLGKNEFQS